ncbi:MAG: hypothetical protein FXF47_06740 [Candidatus Mcinerneyibacterium aminivorans]|uniref:Aerotolerance regulator N-terminal domain-containing protein n=1 Tax=Candidatus Mcinerneyibacterium aminivorans TaxID=2703815 RepID=A0A5D0MD02_9BACT|nr:MAG: hypothetical protein FXF47_06740 [Candidatus Mcinerneyibacterium aminivorans]
MSVENPVFIYLLPAVIIPVLIYLFTRTSRKKLEFPSNIIFEKIIKKQHIKRKNILRLILRMLIILFLVLSFAGFDVFINKNAKKDLIIDISFSSIKYKKNIEQIIKKMEKRNLIGKIYYLDNELYKDNIRLPSKNFNSDNRSKIPYSGKYYFISDNKKNLNDNTTYISNVSNINNCMVYDVKANRDIVLKNEVVEFDIFLAADNKNINTELEIQVDGNTIKTQNVSIEKQKIVKFNYLFNKTGYHNLEFKVRDDSYLSDNSYYQTIYVEETDKTYYINKSNVYLDSIMEVLNIKKGNYSDSTIYFFIVDNNKIEKKILPAAKQNKVFLFPSKGGINFLNFPVSYLRLINSRNDCYFFDEKNRTYTLKKYFKMKASDGKKIAGNETINSIYKWENIIFFNFNPEYEYSNFILKSYLYEKFRKWIYDKKNTNLRLNEDSELELESNIKNIYFNKKNINHLMEGNKLKVDRLNKNGFLEIHKSKGVVYKSVNQSKSEYDTHYDSKDKNGLENIEFSAQKKINLRQIMLFLAILFFIFDSFIVFKERGFFSE